MARRATFSSKSFKPSLINSYGLEMFFCLLVCIFFFFSSNQKSNFFINIKYYVISFSEPGLKIITLPFEYINNSFYYLNDLTNLKQSNKKLDIENKNLNKALKEKSYYQKATLHRLIETIDSGEVISEIDYKLDPKKSYLANENIAYSAAIKLLIKTLN